MNKQFEIVQQASKALKDGFKKTEDKPWSASSFSAELLFQCTHVNCSILNSKGLYVGPTPGIDKGARDEIADVLFNVCNLANHLNISLIDLPSMKEPSPDVNIETLGTNLCIQAGNLWDALFREDGYKHKVKRSTENDLYIRECISSVLLILTNLSDKLSINMIDAYWDMTKDAGQFLENYQSLYKIKDD